MSTRPTDRPTEPRSRVRDMVTGSPLTESLHEQYESYVRAGGVALIGRVFHGYSDRSAEVSLNPDVAASLRRQSGPEKRMINLGSSDYAGLNAHPRVIRAATEALQKFGNGSTGGRLLNGTTQLHVRLEEKLARFLGVEDVITYNSGYCANLSTFSCLCSKGDTVISDILNHKSITDGLKLGGADVITYVHSSIRGAARSVEHILSSLPWDKRKFIVTDGIFSVDGDVARLDEIAALARTYNAFVVVDEAHAIGAFGPGGRGTVAHFGVQDEVDVITGVLSKGLPGIGGFVAGSKRTIDLLRYGSNGYIFSTSLPPSVVAGLIEAIDILVEEPAIQDKLQRNAKRLRDGLKALGFDILGSESAVVPILLPDVDTTLRFTRMLHDDGIYVNAAVYPAVSALRPRIRINVGANLELEQIERALTSIGRCAKVLGVADRGSED